MDPSETVVNNTEKSRFEMVSGSQVSKLEYRMGDQGERIALTHTEVPEDLQEQGIGSALVKFALDYARKEELVVLPYCPFVAAYIRRHQEYKDLVGEL